MKYFIHISPIIINLLQKSLTRAVKIITKNCLVNIKMVSHFRGNAYHQLILIHYFFISYESIIFDLLFVKILKI